MNPLVNLPVNLAGEDSAGDWVDGSEVLTIQSRLIERNRSLTANLEPG